MKSIFGESQHCPPCVNLLAFCQKNTKIGVSKKAPGVSNFLVGHPFSTYAKFPGKLIP